MNFGFDGAVYFLENETRASTLWRLTPPGEGETPVVATPAARLRGHGVSLATEPISGHLFVLLREWDGDYAIYELTPWWLAEPELSAPLEVFRLSEFREEMSTEPTAKLIDDTDVGPLVISVRLPALLVPDDLDFLTFDSLGLMYVGAREADLVLQFDLDRRRDERNAVGLSAVVEETPAGRAPRVRFEAWKLRYLGT